MCTLCWIEGVFEQSVAAGLFVISVSQTSEMGCVFHYCQLFHSWFSKEPRCLCRDYTWSNRASFEILKIKSPLVAVCRCVHVCQCVSCRWLMPACAPDDGYVLLHVPAEYLGGGVRCGQTRHPHPQWQSAGLDPPRGSLWAVPHHIRECSHKYWLWVEMENNVTLFVVETLLFCWVNTLSLPSADAAFDIDSCSMDGTDPLKPKCPVLSENQTPAFPEWLTIIMLCVYLLFANILLLNLLIAIFKSVLQPYFKTSLDDFITSVSSSFLCLSLCSRTALRSRKFRTTRTEYGSFKDTSWLRSTTAALLPLLLLSSSAIFTSSSGTWCCAGLPTLAKSLVSMELSISAYAESRLCGYMLQTSSLVSASSLTDFRSQWCICEPDYCHYIQVLEEKSSFPDTTSTKQAFFVSRV